MKRRMGRWRALLVLLWRRREFDGVIDFDAATIVRGSPAPFMKPNPVVTQREFHIPAAATLMSSSTACAALSNPFRWLS